MYAAFSLTDYKVQSQTFTEAILDLKKVPVQEEGTLIASFALVMYSFHV